MRIMRKYVNWVLLGVVCIGSGYLAYGMHFMIRNGTLCIADGIRYALDVRILANIITMLVIYYLYVTRHDFNAMRVIQMKSRRRMWHRQFKEIVVISLMFTCFMVVLALTLAGFFYREGGVINWDKSYSDYAYITRGYTSSIGIGLVVLKGAALLFFQSIVCLLFCQLVIWLIHIRIVPLLFVISAAIGDAHTTYIPIFFSRFNYVVNQWGDASLRSVTSVLWMFLIAAMLYAIGYFYAEKKEFIGVKDA